MFPLEFKRTIFIFLIASVTRNNLQRRNHRQVFRLLFSMRQYILNTDISNVSCDAMEYNIIAYNFNTWSREISKYSQGFIQVITIGFPIITIKLVTSPIIQIAMLSFSIFIRKLNFVQMIPRILIIVVATKVNIQVIGFINFIILLLRNII